MKRGPEREQRIYPYVQEGFEMKMLIFVIVLALVATIVLWRVRRADAEKNLARHREMKQKQKQRKHAITATHHEKWPTIIHVGGKPRSKEEEAQPGLSMTSIEFEPSDRPHLQN
jgi:hypothetical protein